MRPPGREALPVRGRTRASPDEEDAPVDRCAHVAQRLEPVQQSAQDPVVGGERQLLAARRVGQPREPAHRVGQVGRALAVEVRHERHLARISRGAERESLLLDSRRIRLLLNAALDAIDEVPEDEISEEPPTVEVGEAAA